MTSGDHESGLVPESPNERYLTDVEVYAEYDEEFRLDAVAAAEAVGVDELRDLIGRYARHDLPSIVLDPDGTEHRVQHHILRRFLQVLPDYAEKAAAAGLAPEQAAGLVRTMLTAEDRHYSTMADPAVSVMGRALETQAQAHGPIGPEDYERIRNLVAGTARYGDVNASALDTFRALSRLGMTTAEGTEFIQDDLYSDQLLMNPVLGVLEALSIAEVDGTRLKGILRDLIRGEDTGKHIYAIQNDINLLRECIATVCPRRDIRPDDMLALVATELARGRSMTDIAGSFIGDRRLPAADDTGMYDPTQRAARHFIDKPGPLELSPLPYRTERSFGDGLADLGRIALHRFVYREPVGEGLWLFDGDSTEPVWYSLGGETEVRHDSVRHSAPDYPLHELSRNPTMAHCHPQELEVIIAPSRHEGTYPRAAISIIGQLYAATPSRRDYDMIGKMLRMEGGFDRVRSVIVHGNGVTEYTFPQDPDALEEMSRDSQAVRDQLLLGIRWDRILHKRRLGGLAKGGRRDDEDVVRELVERLDEALPRDFGLELSRASGAK